MTRIMWICYVVLMHRLCHSARYNLLHLRNIYVQILSHDEIIEFSAGACTAFLSSCSRREFENIVGIFFFCCRPGISHLWRVTCAWHVICRTTASVASASLLVSNVCMYIRALLHDPHFATFWQESYRRPPECSYQCPRMTWSKL